LSQALQGRLKTDGAIDELTVEKSLVAGFWRTVTTLAGKAEESPLLEAIARERLLMTAGWKKA
jgi:hypothetical protein